MAHVDEYGLLVSDPGDAIRVTTMLRKSGNTPLIGNKPDIGVNHTTGNLIPLGANASYTDGTDHMAKNAASGSARYYPHGYLSRDGSFYQVVSFDRSCIACSGDYLGKSINRTAVQVEWTGLGWVRARDGYYPSHDPITVDVKRPDLARYGTLMFQIPTAAQVQAAGDLWLAVVAWSGMDPRDALHGHKELSPSDGHECPGAAILDALFSDIAPRLGAGVPS
jgi:hypothetical protein